MILFLFVEAVDSSVGHAILHQVLLGARTHTAVAWERCKEQGKEQGSILSILSFALLIVDYSSQPTCLFLCPDALAETFDMGFPNRVVRHPALAVPHLSLAHIGHLDFEGLKAMGCKGVIFDKVRPCKLALGLVGIRMASDISMYHTVCSSATTWVHLSMSSLLHFSPRDFPTRRPG